MKKFVFIAAVLGFTNVFVAMTQQKNSPIPLHNNGIETFTVYEADGSNYCYNGGRGGYLLFYKWWNRYKRRGS